MQIDSPQTPWRLLSAPSTPKSLTRPRTASQILAQFSPKPQFKKSPLLYSSPSQAYPIVMTNRQLRQKKQPVSYEISSEEDNANSQLDSSFSSPAKISHKRISIVDLEDELEEIESPKTPPPRLSTAGHSLRQHCDLKQSLQAREDAGKRVIKKRKITKRKAKDILMVSSRRNHAPQRTARNEVRDYINTETAGKRARFFLAKKDVFLPLLPESNYIQTLASRSSKGITGESVEYQVIEKQPAG